MEPLLLFLSSSMNVEFVYTILKGICKFTLLNFTGEKFTAEQTRKFQKMQYTVASGGDTTIKLFSVKVKSLA